MKQDIYNSSIHVWTCVNQNDQNGTSEMKKHKKPLLEYSAAFAIILVFAIL